MAKMNKTLNFSNAEFKVSKDELTGEKRIMILLNKAFVKLR